MSPAYPKPAEAIGQIRRADARFDFAVRSFATYEDRLRELADAARAEQRAMLFAEVCEVQWKASKDADDIRLDIGLEPGHRIGPESLWVAFDGAVSQLRRARLSGGWSGAAAAFGEIAAAASDLADAIERSDKARQTG